MLTSDEIFDMLNHFRSTSASLSHSRSFENHHGSRRVANGCRGPAPYPLYQVVGNAIPLAPEMRRWSKGPLRCQTRAQRLLSAAIAAIFLLQQLSLAIFRFFAPRSLNYVLFYIGLKISSIEIPQFTMSSTTWLSRFFLLVTTALGTSANAK